MRLRLMRVSSDDHARLLREIDSKGLRPFDSTAAEAIILISVVVQSYYVLSSQSSSYTSELSIAGLKPSSECFRRNKYDYYGCSPGGYRVCDDEVVSLAYVSRSWTHKRGSHQVTRYRFGTFRADVCVQPAGSLVSVVVPPILLQHSQRSRSSVFRYSGARCSG